MSPLPIEGGAMCTIDPKRLKWVLQSKFHTPPPTQTRRLREWLRTLNAKQTEHIQLATSTINESYTLSRLAVSANVFNVLFATYKPEPSCVHLQILLGSKLSPFLKRCTRVSAWLL